jgi:hypothetical protein
MAIPSNRKKYLARMLVLTLVLILIISVALNWYDNYVIRPQMQATMNDMRVTAFISWQNEMSYTRSALETARRRSETYNDFQERGLVMDDFEKAEEYLHSAGWSAAILLTDVDTGYYPEEAALNLYHWIDRATNDLGAAIDELIALVFQDMFQNQSSLDQYILLRIENITQAIHSMIVFQQLGQYSGVDLVKQLQDDGKLADVMNYCKQIAETSIEVLYYARDKLQ